MVRFQHGCFVCRRAIGISSECHCSDRLRTSVIIGFEASSVETRLSKSEHPVRFGEISEDPASNTTQIDIHRHIIVFNSGSANQYTTTKSYENAENEPPKTLLKALLQLALTIFDISEL